MKMEELKFSRSTFVLKDQQGSVVAACCMHVDDGLLAGDPTSKEYQQLLKAIDQAFNIKEWKKLGTTPTTYLGMDVIYDQKKGEIVDDMKLYVMKIFPMEYEAKNEEKLSPKDTTKFRRLVMQMRWPAQHVLPEYMFVISHLAQRVTSAVGADAKKANDVLAKMRRSAENGKAVLRYRKLQGKLMVVSYFDASLGKKEAMAAQLGEFHLQTTEAAKNEITTGNPIEYHSNKIARVVRSSMAAEGCAMTTAADHQLLSRMLCDAFWHGRTDVSPKWKECIETTGAIVTDAKSLYDHCLRVGHMATERQTALDILAVKTMIQENLVKLFWTPTFKQLADALTKEMDDILLRKFRKDGKVCLVQSKEDEQIEVQRAQIRKGQRERRNLRMKSAKQPTRFSLNVKI